MEKTQTNQTTLANVWRLPLIATGGLIVLLLLIYYPTTASLIHIWNSSETFTHGYLILPISIWLVWHNRTHFYHLTPTVNYSAIPFVLAASFVWLVAYFIDVNVIQQLAMVSIIPLIVFSVMGWQVTKVAAFPLFFLIFAVPMGEGLVPVLIEFTADFTVAMVQMTGIPIYREGTFFQLPTGNWSVVEACSGVRYLIASMTLGFLYAYLNYQSPYRRAAFILAAIIVPIIANGLRAFMIVMIGHFSGMKLAVGVDHLIYGWVFFGIVIAIMFYVGSFWREDEPEIEEPKNGAKKNNVSGADGKSILVVSFVLLVVASLLPLKGYTDKVEITETSVVMPSPKISGWEKTDSLISEWTPRYKNTDVSIGQNYSQNGASVDLYVGYYIAQREGAQLVTSTNVLTEEQESWQNIGQSSVELTLPSGMIQVPLARIRSGDSEILVAYFYFLGGKAITNDYVAKLTEAKNRLFGGDRSASIVAVSSALSESREETISRIQAFIQNADNSIFQAIESVGEPN